MTTCSSCGAEIIWAVTAKSRPIPVDPAPHEDGNLIVEYTKHGIRTARVAADLFDKTQQRYRSHFASCPDAAKHRRPR